VIRAIWAIAGKELRELLRDPLSLGLSLVLPLILLFLLTYGLDLDVERVRLGVYDLDRSASSRDYLASLSANGDIVVVGAAADVDELGEWLDGGRIGVGLIVPPDFERTLLARQPARV
jgi:ABC-2 type transport system permease protein